MNSSIGYCEELRLGDKHCPATGMKKDWMNTTKVIPKDIIMCERDTNQFKIADGISLYKDLPYLTPDKVAELLTGLLISRAGRISGDLDTLFGSHNALPCAIREYPLGGKYVALDLPVPTVVGDVRHATVVVYCNQQGDWELHAGKTE